MSILLVLCVLAAAAWLLLSVGRRDSADRPDASVEAYARAMAALSPGESPAPVRRPRPAAAGRPRARGPQPHAAATARRRAPAARRPARR
jgi:hypothetical protein